MTGAFSGMEYPHWLMVAGAILVMLGIIGLAFRQRLAPIERTEVANRNEQRQSDFETQITQANRKAKLAEQTKGRWADKPKPPLGEHGDRLDQTDSTSALEAAKAHERAKGEER